MYFIETHCHLNDEAFNGDRDAVIERSFKSGVSKLVEIACSAKEWEPAMVLCSKYPAKIYACFGIHPGYSEELCPENLAKLEQYLKKSVSKGLGEIGFDYYWDAAKKEQQNLLLEAMISLSNRLGLVSVFHARSGKDAEKDNAYADLAAMLKHKWNYAPGVGKFRGILHCFAGGYEDAGAALDLGLALGVNGAFTYKKNGDLRAIVKKAGLENIVFETDCPYLPPQSARGLRNDPSYIPEIAGAVAAHLGVTPSRAADVTTANAMEIFGAL
jgi:TatD DNase family protein